MKFDDISVCDECSWSEWLRNVTPTAVKIITRMKEKSIPVGELRRAFASGKPDEAVPPDLPGVYGFFSVDPLDDQPLVKFGETFELFARLASHLGSRPLWRPQRYREEGNSFSGDSSFRTKIARALDVIDETEWQKNRAKLVRSLRGGATDRAKVINAAIDENYRVAWQPLLFGRAEVQLWAEWSDRRTQMLPHPLRARLRPAFDRSLFGENAKWWRSKLALHMGVPGQAGKPRANSRAK